jgi:hypothetical protein
VVFHVFHILIKIHLACKVKVGLKKIFSIQFQTYLLPNFIVVKFFKFLYSTYHKPNWNINIFKMKNKFCLMYVIVFMLKIVIFSNEINWNAILDKSMWTRTFWLGLFGWFFLLDCFYQFFLLNHNDNNIIWTTTKNIYYLSYYI